MGNNVRKFYAGVLCFIFRYYSVLQLMSNTQSFMIMLKWDSEVLRACMPVPQSLDWVVMVVAAEEEKEYSTKRKIYKSSSSFL